MQMSTPSFQLGGAVSLHHPHQEPEDDRRHPPDFRHKSLPPPADLSSAGPGSSATLPAGFAARRRRAEEEAGRDLEDDIYESIYDSRWRLMQKVGKRSGSPDFIPAFRLN